MTKSRANGAYMQTAVYDDYAALMVQGELDMNNAPQLWQLAQETFTENNRNIMLIDLTAAQFLDSMTIAVLIQLFHQATRRGIKLGIIRGRRTIADRILDLAGVGLLVPLFVDETEAVTALSRD